MTKGTRKFLKITFLTAVVLVVAFVATMILVPVKSDMTARSKVVIAAVLMSDARNVLQLRCKAGSLKPGMTNVDLGFPDPYRPDPEIGYVKDIDISVVAPDRALVSANLGDVYTEFLPFWKTLEIPAGARLVLELRCEKDGIWFTPHESTTVPEKFLIDILKRQKQVPAGKVS